MINISDIAAADNEREVRYTSNSKQTVQLGKVAGVDGDYVMVSFHTHVKPKTSNKAMAGDPVACDPDNLEFV